jgi:hypothetical protein
MVEAQDRRGQQSMSMKEFAGKFGYVPPTVTGHERNHDGLTLITTNNDPEKNLELYDDDREMHYSGETPDWAEEE